MERAHPYCKTSQQWKLSLIVWLHQCQHVFVLISTLIDQSLHMYDLLENTEIFLEEDHVICTIVNVRKVNYYHHACDHSPHFICLIHTEQLNTDYITTASVYTPVLCGRGWGLIMWYRYSIFWLSCYRIKWSWSIVWYCIMRRRGWWLWQRTRVAKIQILLIVTLMDSSEACWLLLAPPKPMLL